MAGLVGPFALSGLINGIFALAFGLLVIFKNRKSRINRLFFFMTVMVAFWSFCYWRWLLSTSHADALFWIRLLSVWSLLIPIYYFHWTVTLLDLNKAHRFLLRSVYVAALFLLFFSFSKLFVTDVSPKLFFPFWPTPGILYTFYLLTIYLGLVAYGLFLLLKNYRGAPMAKQGQIFYVVLGSLLGFGGGATNFFLWYNVPIPPYGNFLVTLFPFFLGYAILKHKLFDLRAVATELLIFSIWMFLLVRALLASTLLDRLLDLGLLSLLIPFGILLLRSVLREVEAREKIEAMAVELAVANEELKKLDAAKSEFISIAGHQLRTPLTIIKGYTSMVLEGSFGKIEAAAREALHKVFISTTTLANLVSDLLDLSRIESGKIRYEFKDIRVSDIVNGVIQELEETARIKDIRVILNDQVPPAVRALADFDKLHEVVINLIDNAIKYSTEGPVEVGLKYDAAGKKIILSVKDRGMGIKPEDISKLFTKFMRSEDAKKIRPEGMGLGLYLAKKIVEDHKGRVSVKSPGLGQGSTFFVEIPTHA
ncbi:MAG: hypothetical protein HY220_01135 [Candidatus Sungbacteria bacterium]|uniref:histidine kinase n=1 Tax=Candidatus Sungiibacteriota bacterium TaxID=2750080 RepID=A0A9D6QVE1_9BACT|nr:hypothetical protein [Candidatus Sungbacteria bacterium]